MFRDLRSEGEPPEPKCKLSGMRGDRRTEEGGWIVDCLTHGWTGPYTHNGYFGPWRCPWDRCP